MLKNFYVSIFIFKIPSVGPNFYCYHFTGYKNVNINNRKHQKFQKNRMKYIHQKQFYEVLYPTQSSSTSTIVNLTSNECTENELLRVVKIYFKKKLQKTHSIFVSPRKDLSTRHRPIKINFLNSRSFIHLFIYKFLFVL